MANSPKSRTTKRGKRTRSAAKSEARESESSSTALAVAEHSVEDNAQESGASDAAEAKLPPELATEVEQGLVDASEETSAAGQNPEESAADEEEEDELRIRTVQELLALPEGEGEVELLLFKLGDELFAFDLVAAEEAVELELLHRVPDMPPTMLGVFDLRGKLVPVYSPSSALRSPRRDDAGVLLLMRVDERRVGLAVDDVEDVMMLERTMLRPPPVLDSEAQLLLGVAFFGDSLVSILDARSLIAACAATTISEAA